MAESTSIAWLMVCTGLDVGYIAAAMEETHTSLRGITEFPPRPTVPCSGADLDSRPLYYRGVSGGVGGNWVDRTARQWIRETHWDEKHYLAKVWVAGSNPVLRCIVAGQRWCFNPCKTTSVLLRDAVELPVGELKVPTKCPDRAMCT